MINIGTTVPISPEQARNIIQYYTDQYGLYIDIERVNDYIIYYKSLYEKYKKQFMKDINITIYDDGSRATNISIFKNELGIPSELINTESNFRTQEKESLGDATKVRILESTQVSTEVKEIVKIFYKMKEATRMVSYIQQYLDGEIGPVESEDNHRLCICKPTWSVLNTGRISAAAPSLQNIPAEIGDIISAPKGKILVRADSGQIEPRITYSCYIKDLLLKDLIIKYNDAYLGMLMYILMSSGEEHEYRNGKTYVPVEITNDIIEKRKMLKKILLVGNYGGNLSVFPAELANGFTQKIQKHPMRLAWEESVREQVLSGNETFYTMFGRPIVPGATTKYEQGGSGWINHVIRCGINNPIQGTASDLMNTSVYTADMLIRKKAKGDTSIAFYKHDEGAFYIDEKDADLIQEFKEITAYQVQDWIPIYADAEIGKKGGNPDAKHY